MQLPCCCCAAVFLSVFKVSCAALAVSLQWHAASSMQQIKHTHMATHSRNPAASQFEARKGWDVLLDAYLNEFAGTEAVELHIVTKAFGKGKEVCCVLPWGRMLHSGP